MIELNPRALEAANKASIKWTYIPTDGVRLIVADASEIITTYLQVLEDKNAN